jgi:Mg2+-importing ATPase
MDSTVTPVHQEHYMSIQQHRPPLRSADYDAKLRTATETGLSLETTLASVQANLNGLTDAEALSRLTEYGPNEVDRDKPAHALIQLALAFKNPFIAVLMVLAAVSAVTDIILPMRSGEDVDYTGVLIIVVMVTLSGLLRFWQEYRSGKAAQALKAMVRTTASVQRRSTVSSATVMREIPMSQIVPGDIVRLSAGDMIPADLRLIESRDLFVSQAALTGEALPVEKYDVFSAVSSKSASASSSQAGVLEQNNMCFMGTNVVSGTATAVVVATGAKTYFGSLAKAIVGSRAETSFDRGVNSVSWLLIRFMLVMVPIVLLINGFSKGDWTEAFLFALAVAVGLTPEMLPMIVSSNLAKGAVAMAKNKVVVKRLNAIQNFGAMDVLCTDKTGTLTRDKIILVRHLDIHGHEKQKVLEYAYLNSFYQTGLKNLLDVAVLEHAAMDGVKPSYNKVDEIPFDFVRRRMSVVLANGDGRHVLICKGAVEEMLAICAFAEDDGQIVPLTADLCQQITAMTAISTRTACVCWWWPRRPWPRPIAPMGCTMSATWSWSDASPFSTLPKRPPV